MSLVLPPTPEDYDAQRERERNLLLEQEDRRNLKRGTDVEVDRARLILRSPNGTRWQVEVDDTGALSTSQV